MEKIARICWNNKGWKRPSGRVGKSLSKDSYEWKYGFGHEEWLLDFDKIDKDGFQYGFLQSLNIKSSIHLGNTYDIHLFTISPNKQRLYVGCLRNAVCISPSESEEVYNYYVEKGWIDDMYEDVKSADGEIDKFIPSEMFNIKFKCKEAKINIIDEMPIIQSDSIGHRYNLMNKRAIFIFDKEDDEIKTLDTSLIIKTNKVGEVIIDPRHKKIQNAVVKLLGDQYAQFKIEKGKVDITGIKGNGELHFFEVKTNASAKLCIREALGQILEYSYYPNISRAKSLFIVGPEEPQKDDISYMNYLRNNFKLPIWYRWYSFPEDKIYESV